MRKVLRVSVPIAPHTAYEPLSADRKGLLELTRLRSYLVNHRTSLKNRNSEKFDIPDVAEIQGAILAVIDAKIDDVDKRIKAYIQERKELLADYNLLYSIRGVALVTAATVLAELGDLRRFEKARQLGAFVGLSPHIIRSGSSVRGRTKMSINRVIARCGRLYIWRSLSSKSGDSALADSYSRALERGMVGKAALGVVMRKLLMIMRAVLISGEAYEPHHSKAM